MGNGESGCGGIRMCEGVSADESISSLDNNATHSATIYVLGGTGSSEGMSQLMTVEKFDVPRPTDVKDQMSLGKWHESQKMSTPRLGACGAYADGCLYIVGGWNGTSHDCSMEKYNPVTKVWTDSEEMRAPRTFSGMAALGSVLYVCGGMTMQKADEKDVQWNTSTVEKFDIARNQWEGVTSMGSPRLGPAVVAHGTDKIIVLGGVDGDGTALQSVEWLDTNTNRWTALPDLQEARAAPGAVVHNNDIYIFGGCGVDGIPLSTGWRLRNPFGNNDGWEQMPPMNLPRGGFGMVLAGSVIVAIGGSSVDSQHLRDTEYLDLSQLTSGTAKWQVGEKMNHERRYPGVIVQPPK